MPRYQNTDVPPEQSQAELKKLLRDKGGTNWWLQEPDPFTTIIGFTWRAINVRITFILPKNYTKQSERTYWRGVLGYVREGISAVELGIRRPDQVFFSDIVMPNDYTVDEMMGEVVRESVKMKQMPAPGRFPALMAPKG